MSAKQIQLQCDCLEQSVKELYPELAARIFIFAANKYQTIITNQRSMSNPISNAKRSMVMDALPAPTAKQIDILHLRNCWKTRI